MHTASLRQQHAELGQLLTRAQDRYKAGAPGAELRAILVELSGKLSVHLAGEDRMIYPALQKSPDPAVAAMARRFAEEMGGLGSAFKAFTGKYASGAAIDADRAGFGTAFAGIVAAVGKRVQAEERELYAAADKHVVA